MCADFSSYNLLSLGYSTVKDYSRYFEELPELLGPKGDLKDVQRPWALETIRNYLSVGAAIADMGGSSCELAECLMDDYDITVIDPYDGSGNGPRSYSHLEKRFPKLSFIQDTLNSTTSLPRKFDAVVSTSVVEHIPPNLIKDAMLGVDRALKPGGYSIHAIDFTVRGEGRIKEIVDEILQQVFTLYNVGITLEEYRQRILSDHEAYYLSPLMFQQWRANRSYEAYPWRQVATCNIVLQKPKA